MVHTLPDIAGTDAAVPLTTDRSLISRGWVQFAAVGGTAKVGDNNVTVSRGIPVPDSQGFFLPPINYFGADAYVLADLYAYIPSGCTLSIAWSD